MGKEDLKMAEEYGIKETKEVVGFAVELANGVGKSLEDGKWDIGDFVHFMDALMMAPAAIQGITSVPAELGDLSQPEIQEISDYVIEEFDIPQDEVEGVVEDAIKIGWDIYYLIKRIGEL